MEPTPVPTPAESMPGMSKTNAALYMAAGRGETPTPPDFSKPSYARDRKRLAELVALAEACGAAGLRAYAIRVFYTGRAGAGPIPASRDHRHQARTRQAAAA
jgi:hypothetical protein